jgi:hypothetical protein
MRFMWTVVLGVLIAAAPGNAYATSIACEVTEGAELLFAFDEDSFRLTGAPGVRANIGGEDVSGPISFVTGPLP